MERIITVLGLTKQYDNLIAVDHINFEVSEGEIFGFLGPNGASKTSTIRMLTGLSQPNEGMASVLGHDLKNGFALAKKGFGVVPEISNLYDELSALENLVFIAQLYGVPRPKRVKKAEELLELFGLSEKRDARFHTLSRGMKRTLTIAAALIHEPQLLFLDEPTTGLDVMHARSLRSLIRQLNKRGVTIFLTTHYLEEADLLCDRIAILVRGRIVALDTPENLKMAAEEEPACEVSFSPMLADAASELKKEPGISGVVEVGSKLRLCGDKASIALQAALRYAEVNGLEIRAANLVKPSLEDAFVKLTGLSTEVMLAEKGGK